MTRLLFVLLLLVTASAEAAIVRIKGSAMVDRAIIRLEDVAEVFEDDAETLSRLKAVTIEPAPIPGAQRRLSLQQITERLRAHAVDLASIEFSGRTVVLVGRNAPVAQVQTTVVAVDSDKHATQWASSKTKPDFRPIVQAATSEPAAPQVKQENRSLRLTSKEIRDAEKLVFDLVKTHMTEQAANWGAPRISVHVPTTVVPKLLDAPIGGLRIAEGKKISEKTFAVSIEIKNEFGKCEVITVTADIVKRPKVVVTTRALPIGHIISEKDVRLEEVDVAQRDATDLEQVVGKETKASLRVGQRMAVDCVAEPTLIRRGERIKGEVIVGAIRVVQEFKALRDGRLNEVLEMETILGPGTPKGERPQKRFGTVIGPKQVEIIDAPEGSVRTGLQLLRNER